MKITAIKAGILLTPLKTPFKTAVRSVSDMTDVVVRIETDEGLAGWGSAPPTDKVTGDTVGSITGALEASINPALTGMDPCNLEECLDALDASIQRNTSAKAAVDIALHDLWARSLGQPAWRLWGGSGKVVRSDVTVSINSPEEMARDAADAAAEGFDTIKVKLGIDAELDFQRLRAIRGAVGGNVQIRVDANQGWTAKEAVRLIHRMCDDGLDIELVEQPVPAHDLDGLSFVTANVPIPVVADESCWSPADALQILQRRAADMVNVKLMKCGGIRAARRIVDIAAAMDAEVMIGAMLEGKISTAAAVHLASTYGNITKIDLDGPTLAASDPVDGGPAHAGPEIAPGDGPGFGVRGVQGVKWL